MEISQLLIELTNYNGSLKDRTSLIQALTELDQLIGLKALKRAVVDQILFFLANIRIKGLAGATDGHVLHTLIYGPPGVGKTVVGSLLARIWASIGVLKSNTTTETPLAKAQRENTALLARVERGTTAAEATRLKIREMRSKLFAFRMRSRRSSELDSCLYQQELQKIQKITRISSDALNYCAMAINSLNETNNPRLLPVALPLDSIFRVVSRGDCVAEYMGQSTPKTRKLLTEHRGKVLMFDEAYSLYQGDRDSFGMEVLTVINQDMTEHADETALIFAGYKWLMIATIFKAQPGLQRRFAYTFEITGYTPEELALIFQQQLTQDQWTFQADDPSYLTSFFQQHQTHFRSYGGDTKRLLFQAKMVATSHTWNQPEPSRVVTPVILEEALKRYQLNQPLNVERLELLETQRTYEEELLLQQIKEFQERKSHQELYTQARQAERQELQRKLKKQEQEVLFDQREVPHGMYS